MARVVEALFDRAEGSEYGRFADYPWGEWTNGMTWEVTNEEPDRDFHVSIRTFRVYLYQYKEMLNRGEVEVQPDLEVAVKNRWACKDGLFKSRMAALGCTSEKKALASLSKSGVVWKVTTHIVSPGVIRFYFEPTSADDQS